MRAELKALRWFTLAYFVVLEALLVFAIVFWPRFEEKAELFRGLIPLQAIDAIFDRIGDEGVSAYVLVQHFFKGCNLVGAVVAVFFAMGAVAGEAHRGTLEIWLARPLSRRRILSERFAAGALGLTVPVFATTATIPWLMGFVHEQLDLGPLLLGALHQSAFLLALYAVTFAWSCVSSRPLVIGFTMLALSIFEFALYVVEHLTHASVLRLSDLEVYANIYQRHTLDPWIFGPLIVWTAACFALSLRLFARRVP